MNLSSTLFKYRSYTPLPFLLIMILYENANIWSLIAGFFIAVAGEFIRLWGVGWAGSETRTTGEVGGSFLIVSGPFAHLRNPLYLGNILIYTGLGVMSFAVFPYLQIVGFLFFYFQYRMIIKEEERYLQSRFGTAFVDYKKNVPRFFPRITPYKANSVEQPVFKIKAGLRSEKRSLQALSFVSLTLFLLWFVGRL
ncbi:MAG TPA: isoprenylcysteine carboxylmethyltransferase family protein [Ignavibacteriaceae bacterium]|jgi:protein-S-isoprenylcysteine O-methyltransferase Ste14|nr:isoprenylcysteine carboxylmethyltransferase family protein [Ignavibacteriaceae bacterium]